MEQIYGLQILDEMIHSVIFEHFKGLQFALYGIPVEFPDRISGADQCFVYRTIPDNRNRCNGFPQTLGSNTDSTNDLRLDRRPLVFCHLGMTISIQCLISFSHSNHLVCDTFYGRRIKISLEHYVEERTKCIQVTG